jgi:glutathione synthase/RimK-type ligase-like ATP-grasp enzyme
MILLCGIPSERPLAMVAAALEALGEPALTFNQRAVADAAITFALDGSGVTGELRLGGRTVALEEITGVYTRMMDDRLLPELAGEPDDSPRRSASRVLHDALWRWLEIAPARVLNRASAMASNASKPYQAQIIRACGFEVPETLMTNDPALVRAFLAEHRRVVFKSASGARSVVTELDDAALGRLESIRWCPVQFQAHIPGRDVRVHVVGERIFATGVRSEATDYRYGDGTELAEVALADEIAARCLELSRRLGLPLTGIDLRMADDGSVVCFEANPSPAFSYYESHTGQPIAAAVARYLRDGAA